MALVGGSGCLWAPLNTFSSSGSGRDSILIRPCGLGDLHRRPLLVGLGGLLPLGAGRPSTAPPAGRNLDRRLRARSTRPHRAGFAPSDSARSSMLRRPPRRVRPVGHAGLGRPRDARLVVLARASRSHSSDPPRCSASPRRPPSPSASRISSAVAAQVAAQVAAGGVPEDRAGQVLDRPPCRPPSERPRAAGAGSPLHSCALERQRPVHDRLRLGALLGLGAQGGDPHRQAQVRRSAALEHEIAAPAGSRSAPRARRCAPGRPRTARSPAPPPRPAGPRPSRTTGVERSAENRESAIRSPSVSSARR